MMWLIILVLVVLAVLLKNPKLLEKIKGGSGKIGFTDPKIFIAIGIAMVNWMTWTLDKIFWKSLWNDQGKFWSINVGLWFALVLLLVKKEDGKSVHPIAKWISRVVGIMLLAILISAISKHVGGFKPAPKPATQTANLYYGVPMDVALQAIADCETGGGIPGAGHQFVPNSNKKPVRNPQNLFAVGKWQINLADETVTRLVDTNHWNVQGKEADNRTAAEYLYKDFVSRGGAGVNPWEETRGCWEPRLLAYAGGQASPLPSRPSAPIVLRPSLPDIMAPMNSLTSAMPRARTREAPVGKYGEQIPGPEDGGMSVISEPTNGKFVVLWNGEIEEEYPREKGVASKIPERVFFYRLKSLEDGPLNITVY